MFLEVEKLNSPCGASDAESSFAMEGPGAGAAGPRPRSRHQHSHSMDVSSYDKTEQLLGARAMEEMSPAESKKAMSTAKLAELALVDPKKAKRIWANRQSAARSKERKMWYISELERKVQTLHSEATTLSTQLALLQRDTTGLTTENSELKMRLQNVEQQVHLQDALNDALKSELQRLKMATGQMGHGGGMMNFGGPPHSFGGNQQMFRHQNQAMQQMQHLHLRPPHQQPPHPHQPLHPLHAQQLQQAALDLKMKGPMAAPGQWGDGWSESSGC